MKQKLKISGIIICFIVLILFLYSSAFFAQYVWDDALLFVNKTGLIEEPFSWTLISGPVLPNTSYFRPLVFLSWYFEFQIFGLNPVVSHTIGLIVFIINNLLLFSLTYVLAQRLNHSKPIVYASIATLLYLTHPALIESTAWISGRFDQFVTFFSLITFIIFTKKFINQYTTLSWGSSFWIGLGFFCALLSKEIAVWIPLTLFMLYILFEKKTASYRQLIRNAIHYQYPLIVMLVLFFSLYIILRLNSVSHDTITIFNSTYIHNAILGNFVPLHAIKYYILQIFIPFSHISLLQPLEQIDQSILSLVIAFFCTTFVGFIFYFALLKRNISAIFGFCAFIYLFLVLYFIPVGIANNLGHSRFLTLPMVFVVLAVVFLPYQNLMTWLKLSLKKMKILVGIVLIFWLGLSIITVKTIVPFWSNEYTLWYWAYQTHPNSKLARANYLNALINQKDFDEVIIISENYIKEHGALEANEQVTYAAALLNKNDPESLEYLAGVIAVLPKLHEENSSTARKKADYFLMSSAQISDCYTLYALALIKFKGDIQGAMQNFKIAEWYLLDDQKEYLNYYIAATLYLNQQYDEALGLYQQQKQKTIKRGGNAYIYTPAIIGQYCHSRENIEPCQRFVKETEF
jgi:hypothetical protein